MIDCVIDYETTGAAGVEDSVVSVLSTRTVEIWGRECLCMKGGSEDGFAFTICALMDYSIIDFEVADVLGDAWSMVCSHKGERVMTGVTRIVSHPLASGVISIPPLGLCGGMRHPCWISGSVKKGRWGVVNQLVVLFFHIWVDNVGEDRDVSEV